MSMLPPNIAAALQQLLPALASPDNNIRLQAEENLNTEWIANQPDLLLTGLAEQVRTNEDAGVSDLQWPSAQEKQNSICCGLVLTSAFVAPWVLRRPLPKNVFQNRHKGWKGY